MTHAKKRWSYSTGERGRNRVRIFEHPRTGRLFLELYEAGQRKRIALGHRDREAGKQKAEEVAVALRQAEPPVEVDVSLETLFDNYLREVTPQKGRTKQQHDRAAATRFLEVFGKDRKAATLNRRDWDAFIESRRRGGDGRRGRRKGQQVRGRVITYDLQFLRAVLNWATMAGNGRGGYLLDRNPLKGLPFPKEPSPRRPLIGDEEYVALLSAARSVSPLFELALLLAHETGHRIGSIRLLRWSDVDVERGTIRWRAENDKIGFEHETLLTPKACEALERARRERPSIGDTWVFTAPEDSSKPVSRYLVRGWWRRGEAAAGVTHSPALGWHSLRRKFATELKQMPLKDLCYLGGWKDPSTPLKCYQVPDEATMRSALASRKKVTLGCTN